LRAKSLRVPTSLKRAVLISPGPASGQRPLRYFSNIKIRTGKWRGASVGSGFVISPDGLFLTAYHVMKFCLENHKANDGLSVSLARSMARRLRYKALAGEREFDVQIISHLTEMDSTHGKDTHTPDEII
jgi:hypothetical protein